MVTEEFTIAVEQEEQWCPEINMQRLWRSVLRQAIIDARRKIKNKTDVTESSHARDWLTNYSFDFNLVCDLANIDMISALKQFRKYFNNLDELNDNHLGQN